MSIAASSLRMSPNMFSVRITSKWRGAATSFIAAESTSWCSSSTFGNSSECTRVTTSRHSRLVSSTFILSTLVTRERAAWNAVRVIRSISGDAVLAQVRRALGGALLGPEVDPAGELAHDEQVGAVDELAPQGAGVEQRGERPDRPQVGVEAEALAEAEEPLLGPRRVPRRSSATSGPRPRRAGRRRRLRRRRASRRSAQCRGRRSRRRRTAARRSRGRRRRRPERSGPRRAPRGRSRRRAG